MLNPHLKSHSNIYQYRCENCTYATKYCHSLKLHLGKYAHRPATILNLESTPNPYSVIDVYGTRRGPRPRKGSTEQLELPLPIEPPGADFMASPLQLSSPDQSVISGGACWPMSVNSAMPSQAQVVDDLKYRKRSLKCKDRANQFNWRSEMSYLYWIWIYIVIISNMATKASGMTIFTNFTTSSTSILTTTSADFMNIIWNFVNSAMMKWVLRVGGLGGVSSIAYYVYIVRGQPPPEVPAAPNIQNIPNEQRETALVIQEKEPIRPTAATEIPMREQPAMAPLKSTVPEREPSAGEPSETCSGQIGPSKLSMQEQPAMSPLKSVPSDSEREPSAGEPESNVTVPMPKVDKQEPSKSELLLLHLSEGKAFQTVGGETGKSITLMPIKSSPTRQVSMPLPQQASTSSESSGRIPLIGSEATVIEPVLKSIAPIQDPNEQRRLPKTKTNAPHQLADTHVKVAPIKIKVNKQRKINKYTSKLVRFEE